MPPPPSPPSMPPRAPVTARRPVVARLSTSFAPCFNPGDSVRMPPPTIQSPRKSIFRPPQLTPARPLSAVTARSQGRGVPLEPKLASRITHRGGDWIAPQDVEDGAFVAKELDTFEVFKTRQLAPSLNRTADALPLEAENTADKVAHHKAMKEQIRLTGGRRPGSKANTVVIYQGTYFRKYANPIESGKSLVMAWLNDVRSLRLHPYVLMLRSCGVTNAADLLPAWFAHSKQNTQLTLTNSHTAMRNMIDEVLGGVNPSDVPLCNALYVGLNDKKHGTLDYAPAITKLQILLDNADEVGWERCAQYFFSGAFSFVDQSEFISAFELAAMISVFETLIDETDATLPPAAAKRAVPVTLRRVLMNCKADVAELAQLQRSDRMLLKAEALDLLPAGGCFRKYLTSGAYEAALQYNRVKAEELARGKKQAERNALLSRISRLRLPVEDLKRAAEASTRGESLVGTQAEVPDKAPASDSDSEDG